MSHIPYKWVLVSDRLAGTTAARAVQTGPRGSDPDLAVQTLVATGRRFRLRDRNGEICYTGYIAGEHTGCEPLDDFGRDNGCSAIEYEREGRWVALPCADAEARDWDASDPMGL